MNEISIVNEQIAEVKTLKDKNMSSTDTLNKSVEIIEIVIREKKLDRRIVDYVIMDTNIDLDNL